MLSSDISNQSPQIITFDEYGVSGHINHRALPVALRQAKDSLPPVFTLQSSRLLAKFSNILTLPFASWKQYHNGPAVSSLLFLTPEQVTLAKQAFEQHASQAVWFRTLYCHFSKYMWFNELRRLDTESATMESQKNEL